MSCGTKKSSKQQPSQKLNAMFKKAEKNAKKMAVANSAKDTSPMDEMKKGHSKMCSTNSSQFSKASKFSMKKGKNGC